MEGCGEMAGKELALEDVGELGIGKEKEPNIFLRLYRKSIIILLLLLFWLIIPNYVHNMFVPPLSEVLRTLVDMAKSGELWKHISSTLFRAFIGLAIAEAIAIPLGIAIGWFPKVEKYLDPVLQVARNTSVLALFPLFVLTLGIGELSKITIVLWGTFFPTLINTIQGVRNVDPLLIRSAQSMGISSLGLFRKVVLPGALPYILAGFRLSAGVSLLVVVGAEMLGADFGLGYMIFYYEQAFQIPKMYVGILVLAVIGVLVNYLISRLEHYLTRWQEKVGN